MDSSTIFLEVVALAEREGLRAEQTVTHDSKFRFTFFVGRIRMYAAKHRALLLAALAGRQARGEREQGASVNAEGVS